MARNRHRGIVAALSVVAVSACAPHQKVGIADATVAPWKLSGMYRVPPANAKATPGGAEASAWRVKPLGPGCFGGQVSEDPWQRRAAASTVHVIAVGNNSVAGATGFVVRDSGENGGPNRIVTAYHVADGPAHPRASYGADDNGKNGVLSDRHEAGTHDPSVPMTAALPPPPSTFTDRVAEPNLRSASPGAAGGATDAGSPPQIRFESAPPRPFPRRPDALGWSGEGTSELPGPGWTPAGAAAPPAAPIRIRLAVLSSSGNPIGYATVVGGSPPKEEGTRNLDFPRGDQAVLEITEWSTGGREEYARIQGVDIAGTQASRMLIGEISDPGGIESGASGSAAFNADGRVEGVVVRKADDPGMGRTWNVQDKIVKAGDGGTVVPEKGPVPTADVNLVSGSRAYVEPLTDFEILHALGNAGRHIGFHSRSDEVRMLAPGFPSGACVVYRGKIAQTLSGFFRRR